MTSNVGARSIISNKRLGFASTVDEKRSYDDMKKNVMNEVKRLFRPEFLNRIDELIVFHSLTKEHIVEIVEIMFKQLANRMGKNTGITIDMTDEAKKYIAEEGYEESYGARPLRRAIQSKVEDKFAEKILDGEFKEGDHVVVDFKDDKLVFINATKND